MGSITILDVPAGARAALAVPEREELLGRIARWLERTGVVVTAEHILTACDVDASR